MFIWLSSFIRDIGNYFDRSCGSFKKKQGKLFFGILMFKSNLALVFDQQNTLCMAKPDTVNLVVLCMSRSSIME